MKLNKIKILEKANICQPSDVYRSSCSTELLTQTRLSSGRVDVMSTLRNLSCWRNTRGLKEEPEGKWRVKVLLVSLATEKPLAELEHLTDSRNK